MFETLDGVIDVVDVIVSTTEIKMDLIAATAVVVVVVAVVVVAAVVVHILKQL